MKKKVHTGTSRAYRGMAGSKSGETAFQVVVEQTDLYILANRDLTDQTVDIVHQVRGEIKNQIFLNPEFGESLVPVKVARNAPMIIRHMADAAEICQVGPMAAVAGAVAQAVADGLRDISPDIVVENGGDVFMHSTKDRVAALLAEPESGAVLGIDIKKNEFPVSLCGSSGRIGHSLSLGHGDLVVVRSASGALSDAAATALANLLKTHKDLDRVIEQARILAKSGVDGVFAQCQGKIAVWGQMELTALG